MDKFLAHIQSREASREEEAQADCGRFLPLRIAAGTREARTRALLDSGNLWRSALSPQFARKLGLGAADLREIDTKTVGTAKQGANLRVLGETRKQLLLQLPQLGLAFPFRPVVIEGLTTSVNISGPWMRSVKWDLLFSNNTLRIGTAETALAVTRTGPLTGGSRVHAAERRVLGPKSLSFISACVPDVRSGRVKGGEGLLEGQLSLGVGKAVPCPGALVTCQKGGSLPAAIFNLSDEEVVIQAGDEVGTFWATEEGGEGTDSISVIGAGKEKGASYREKLVREAKGDGQEVAEREKREADELAARGAAARTEDEKLAWLEEAFHLRRQPCLRREEDLQEAKQVLLEFWDLFSHDGSYGHTHLLKHRVLTEDVPPIKCRYRPVSPYLEENLRAQLEEWLRHSVIEPSNSPWSANLVAARKKNGSIRWCVDWRALNKVTKKDSFPMPTIADTIGRLAGSTIFSGVDMAGAFHCISMDPRDKEKTAFATPFGSFQQKRLGFGLTNGPATYCRLVDRVLKDIPDSVAISFLDDGVIHSADFRGHVSGLRRTLDAYREAGLKLNPKKCNFFSSEVNYLGHTLDKDGIRPTDPYVTAVSKWPLPKLKTEARAFLGVTGYYRHHIPNYAHIAKPWTDVIGKTDKAEEKKALEVTPAMEKAFEELKWRLTHAPVMGFPHFSGPKAGRFTLDTDFCLTQISGILSQEQQGKEVVIAYKSKTLTKHQRNWPSTKGELYAGMYYMQKYAYFLQHTPEPFRWRTDNSALKYCQSLEAPSSIVDRWLTTLADFHFQVEHRAGVKHINADGLSRYGYPERPGSDGLDTAILAVQASTTLHYETEEIRRFQEEDEDIGPARRWVETGSRPDHLTVRGLSRSGKVYAGELDRLSLSGQGLLVRADPNSMSFQPPKVLALPKVLWDEAIGSAHAAGGHQATEATVQRLKQHCWFPSMYTEVRGYVQACTTCQAKQHSQQPQRHTLVSPLSGYPFQRLHVDFVGPLNPGRRTGAKWILTCRDAFSKWVEGIPLVRATADETVRALEREVFTRFGAPESIHSDCGRQFESALFKDVGALLGMKITNTTGYNPKGNGQVERMHRDLGPMLRALVKDDPDSWEDALPQALFALRTAVCRSTGLAPYQILFGRNCSQPLDTIFQAPDNPILEGTRDHHDYVRKLNDRIHRAQAYAREHLADAVIRQRRQYNKDVKAFTPGSKVFLFTPVSKPGYSRKLSSFYTGPWTVCSQPTGSETMIRIAPHPDWTHVKGTKVVSIDRVKPYGDSNRTAAPRETDDLLMEGNEFAEFVALPPALPPAGGPPAAPLHGGAGGGAPPPGGGPHGGHGPPPGGPHPPPGGPRQPPGGRRDDDDNDDDDNRPLAEWRRRMRLAGGRDDFLDPAAARLGRPRHRADRHHIEFPAAASTPQGRARGRGRGRRRPDDTFVVPTPPQRRYDLRQPRRDNADATFVVPDPRRGRHIRAGQNREAAAAGAARQAPEDDPYANPQPGSSGLQDRPQREHRAPARLDDAAELPSSGSEWDYSDPDDPDWDPIHDG